MGRKMKPERQALPSDWKNINIPAGYLLILVVGIIGGYGWLVSTFAPRAALAQIEERILIAQTQLQSLYDARIEQLTIQRDRIARKPNKTAKDLDDLRDIEKELELARKMRAIK